MKITDKWSEKCLWNFFVIRQTDSSKKRDNFVCVTFRLFILVRRIFVFNPASSTVHGVFQKMLEQPRVAAIYNRDWPVEKPLIWGFFLHSMISSKIEVHKMMKPWRRTEVSAWSLVYHLMKLWILTIEIQGVNSDIRNLKSVWPVTLD